MKRVTDIGGIFFNVKDKTKTLEWYKKHLGINSEDWGTSFHWREKERPEKEGYTVWSPFKDSTEYFNPSEKPYMINYSMDNLEELLKALKEEGVKIVDELVKEEYGKLAWIMDPEGNKIELWEPNGK
jgi:predicted enzyme related to lactoylglutathione lyase